MTATPSGPLTPALDQLLNGLSDRALAGRLRRVYVACATAIDRLSSVDLVKYESTVVDGSPDLSLWEEMAPVIRDTVVDVNAVLTVIRQDFPTNTPGGLADTLSRAIEEAGPLPTGSSLARRTQEAERVIQDLGVQLAQEISHLGERMRSPQVVSDRWNLLADLQSFRSRFRALMGDIVYSTASAFAEVSRADVVPRFRDDLKQAITLRAQVADLNRLVADRVKKIREAEPEDLQWCAQQLEKDLDLFGKTAGYKALRAQDKRGVVEFRHEIGKQSVLRTPSKNDLVQIAEPFSQLVSSFTRMNSRDILVEHDRQTWANVGVKLENVETLLGRDPANAAKTFGEAVDMAQALYGREGAMDVFLRKAKKNPVSALQPPQLKQELDKFRELLASLPVT
ncbi:MAG: hypothetical protein ACJ790_09340 [Myxococcaceae bacterium]